MIDSSSVTLHGIAQKADPAHSALLVIDMQNDFCAAGGMMDNEGLDLSHVQTMANDLPKLIESARRAGTFVVFIRSTYSTSTNYYLSESWLEQAQRTRRGSYIDRAVCAPGSWNADFYGDVRPLDTEPVVTKHRFSSFYNTDLDTILRSNDIKTVVLTGVATNVCVETAVRDACVRDYHVLMVANGTATYSSEDHAYSLKTIDRYFGEVVTADQVIKSWSPS